MATAIKTARTLLPSTPVPAGSTATGTGLSLATAFGGLATLIAVNGAVGPAAGVEAILEVSRNGTDWHEFSRQRAGTAATTTYAFHVDVPPGVMNLRAVFSGHSGQAVTIEAYLQELTSAG